MHGTDIPVERWFSLTQCPTNTCPITPSVIWKKTNEAIRTAKGIHNIGNPWGYESLHQASICNSPTMPAGTCNCGTALMIWSFVLTPELPCSRGWLLIVNSWNANLPYLSIDFHRKVSTASLKDVEHVSDTQSLWCYTPGSS